MSRDFRTIADNAISFIALLRDIPWFMNLGKPHPRDHQVVRIWDWKEWPGPEGAHGQWFGQLHPLVQARLLAAHPGREQEFNGTFNMIRETVEALAIPNVPAYEADEDAWHGPTACVWGAGFLAALVGCHILLKEPVPATIADEWAWLADGHWACDYAEDNPYRDEPPDELPEYKLLVY